MTEVTYSHLPKWNVRRHYGNLVSRIYYPLPSHRICQTNKMAKYLQNLNENQNMNNNRSSGIKHAKCHLIFSRGSDSQVGD